jgi:ABC-2 type transport system ATP-binding protein
MTVVLETRGLGRRYGAKWGLRDCSLTVPEGSITGLVGPNGAGKSTLLRLAAGLSRPSEGTVSVFGRMIDPNGTEHLGRIGYLDQHRPIYGSFRVRDMLTLGRKLNPTWDDAVGSQLLSEVGIPLNARVRTLSIGQQAQVSLAICLAKRPDLLLLDEPAGSLDPLARRQLFEALLGTVAERGTTVFLSSHIVSEMEPVCENLIILAASSVRLSERTEEILATHKLIIGGPGIVSIPGVEVISTKTSGRHTHLLVHGVRPELGPDWQVLQPDLEEVVLGYLTQAGEHSAPSDGRSTEASQIGALS